MKGSTKFEVYIHESGPDLKARVKSIFNYMQVTSDNHSRGLGTSVSLMTEQNLTWVFTRFYAVIDRYPELYEIIECETWRSRVTNGLVSREFRMTGEDGSSLVRATASLALIDRTTRKPVEIPGFITEQLEMEKGCSVEFPSSSIRREEDFNYIFKTDVRYEDIDINSHMNNASYAGIFFESVYKQYRDSLYLKTMDIEFKGEIVFGDELECRVTSLGGGSNIFYHRLVNIGNGRVCAHAVTEWSNLL